MHVRTFTGQLTPGAREEALSRFDSTILPILQERENYAGCKVLVNADDEFVVHIEFTTECGPGILREMYEQVHDAIIDIVEDEDLGHSLWQEVISDARVPTSD